jgi:hypothetical protein
MTRDELAAAIKSSADGLVFDAVRVPLRDLAASDPGLAMAEAVRFLLPNVEISSAVCPSPRSLFILVPWGVIALDATRITDQLAEIETQVSTFDGASKVTAKLMGVFTDRGVPSAFVPRGLRLAGFPILGEVASGAGIPIEALGHLFRAMLQAWGDRA